MCLEKSIPVIPVTGPVTKLSSILSSDGSQVQRVCCVGITTVLMVSLYHVEKRCIAKFKGVSSFLGGLLSF